MRIVNVRSTPLFFLNFEYSVTLECFAKFGKSTFVFFFLHTHSFPHPCSISLEKEEFSLGFWV